MTTRWLILDGFWTTNATSKSRCLKPLSNLNDRNWSLWQLQTLIMLKKNVSWMITIINSKANLTRDFIWTNLILTQQLQYNNCQIPNNEKYIVYFLYSWSRAIISFFFVFGRYKMVDLYTECTVVSSSKKFRKIEIDHDKKKINT